MALRLTTLWLVLSSAVALSGPRQATDVSRDAKYPVVERNMTWPIDASGVQGFLEKGPQYGRDADAYLRVHPLANISSFVQHLTHVLAANSSPTDSWDMHAVITFMIFATSAIAFCSLIPLLVSEYVRYRNHHGRDSSSHNFKHYLEYRFLDWFTTDNTAPGLVLLMLSLGLIVSGSIVYRVFVADSSAQALYRIFSIASQSSADTESTVMGKTVGVVITVMGLIILSLLLAILTEAFTTKMSSIKLGANCIVEGGHTVILGFTECTRCLLEELAIARESEGGGVFVILASQPKLEVERSLEGMDLKLRSSRYVVRSGNPCTIRDLQKVSVESARQVIILADSDKHHEQADAKTVRVLLALKTKDWPFQPGRIIVQCSSETNRPLFEHMYGQDRIDVVVVSDIVAKLMIQSWKQHGLATVYAQMLGFEGDEFYAENWPELEGLTFRDILFRFDDAVPLGVFSQDGTCRLNPGWDYVIAGGDKIIVLAEDDDTYEVNDEPYFVKSHDTEEALDSAGESSRNLPLEPFRPEPNKILIMGWNHKICTMLHTLESTVLPGSTVDIYSPRPAEQRDHDLAKFREVLSPSKVPNIKVNQLEVSQRDVTSYPNVVALVKAQYDSVFILADIALDGHVGADEKTVTLLIQMQRAMREHGYPQQHFEPMVEMSEDSTKEHLRIVGVTQLIHSNSILSQCLASVSEDPSVAAIYSDLMSMEGNDVLIRSLQDFLPVGTMLPKKLCFGQATQIVTAAAEAMLFAWSRIDEHGKTTWEMNPKDKVTQRLWRSDDRVVIIARGSGSSEDDDSVARAVEDSTDPGAMFRVRGAGSSEDDDSEVRAIEDSMDPLCPVTD